MSVAVATFLVFWISRWIARPITALAKAARAMGEGRAITAPDPGSVREVHELGNALLNSAAAVREREKALRIADQAKDNFLAMLGHELRNPLSALSSAAQILRIAERSNEASELAAGIIGRQVKHMTRMVDDLLDVARVSTGKITLDRKPLDLGEAVNSALEDMRTAGLLDDQDVRLDTTSVWIEADAARVEQIVTNLVSNALKFTPSGGRIDIRVVRQSNTAVLDISDTGVGLTPELAATIFDLFVQGDQSLDRTTGGLGVGLTLVKRLAELHGGDATAYSAGPDHGTQVRVSFPVCEPVVNDVPTADPQPTVKGITLLLIEDNTDARESLKNALEVYGCRVFDSEDGPKGIRIAEQARPRVAVVDIGLPEMDGIEVARRLRALPGGNSMLLIAISGYGQLEMRRQALASGFDEFVTKPVMPEVLVDIIASACGDAGSDAAD